MLIFKGPNGGTGTQYFIGNWDGQKFSAFPWQPTQYVDFGKKHYILKRIYTNK